MRSAAARPYGRPMSPRSTVSISTAALVLAGAVLVSATGGAVAGSLITSADVKNGSLTGKDVKDGSLKTADLAAGTRTTLTGPAGAPGAAGAPGLSGIVTVTAHLYSVAPGAEGTLAKTCPEGKAALSAAAYWDDSSDAVQVVIGSGGGATAYFENNTGGEDDLGLQVRCALVAP
jgi:hypothetical protein